MNKITITIDLPGADIAPDLIAKVAKYRKAKALAESRDPRKQGATKTDLNLPDQEYLKTEILNGIIDDFKTVVVSEAKQEAAAKARKALEEKLK